MDVTLEIVYKIEPYLHIQKSSDRPLAGMKIFRKIPAFLSQNLCIFLPFHDIWAFLTLKNSCFCLFVCICFCLFVFLVKSHSHDCSRSYLKQYRYQCGCCVLSWSSCKGTLRTLYSHCTVVPFGGSCRVSS